MLDIRQRLLHAAAKAYSETGFRGTTTRRIAQVAGVNEITLFRHFGTKEALVKEALKLA
jgi:AcrR family transcriptional regulator